MRTFCTILLLAVSGFASGQSTTPVNTPWQLQYSGTSAGLRGVYSVDGTVAWASGTDGTILRTIDGGTNWTQCTLPPDGRALDFRAVQAWDARTAVILSSGKGKLSRVYRTTDGCRSWKLAFTNPDTDGFFDAMLMNKLDVDGEIVGDPVDGEFTFWTTNDKGLTWQRIILRGLGMHPQESLFAASNSDLFLDERYGTSIVTGGPQGARVLWTDDTTPGGKVTSTLLPLASGTASAGAFSIYMRDWCCRVVAGGDYQKPDVTDGTAAYTVDGGAHWQAAQTLPHGFRSSVAWDNANKVWIAVGSNGSDVSRDDGKTWQFLDNGNWNAVSLPFAVGPNGRIARLNAAALPAAK